MSEFFLKGCKPRCRHRSPRMLLQYAATVAARELWLISRLNLSSFSSWDIYISANYLGMLQSIIVKLLLLLVRFLGKGLDFNILMSLHTPFSLLCIFLRLRKTYFIFKLFFAIARTRYLFKWQEMRILRICMTPMVSKTPLAKSLPRFYQRHVGLMYVRATDTQHGTHEPRST